MFIDRSNFVFGQHLTKKRVMNIVTYRNADGRKVKKILDRLALFSGGIVINGLILKLTERINERQASLIIKSVKGYVRDSRRSKPQKLIHRFIHSIVFNIGIKPLAIKNKENYAGTIDLWKQMRII